jgi:DNA-binding FadR family transcriptional regulator
MQTLRRPKVRDQATDQIKQFIIKQKLAPGDRLPTETQLAETFGISRLSVREATKSLEFLGILESKTGVGLTVGRIDMQRVTKHLGFHAGLLDADFRQLIDSRVVLETGVLPYVARRMAADAAIEVNLRNLSSRIRSARDLKTRIDLDVQFHHSLLEASGLQPLVAFGDLLDAFFQRFHDSLKKADWKSGLASHDRIIDHLAAAHIDDATVEVRMHIESHKERIP